MTTPTTNDQPADRRPALSGRNLLRRLGPSIAISVVAPVLVYEVVQSIVDDPVVALAIGAAVPAAWTLGRLLIRRVVDPIGIVGLGGFGIGLLVVWLSGGSPLALELRDAVPSGLLGLACLVSVLVRRPLYLLLRRGWAPDGPRPISIRTSMVITAGLGALLLMHGLALMVLALTVSTGTFVALSQPVSLSILAVGVAGLVWYRKRLIATR